MLQVINKIIPIRMHAHEELLGADFFEHDIHHPGVGVSRAVSVLQHYHEDVDVTIERKGGNKGELRRVFLVAVLDVGMIFEVKFQHVKAQNMSF